MFPSVVGRQRYLRMRVVRQLSVTTLVVLGFIITGCGGTTAPAKSDTATTSTPTTAVGGFLTPEIQFGTGAEGAPDPTTTVPVERGTRPISPSNDAGQEVIIAKGGFLIPEWLVADFALPITWTNLSGVPQQIIFDDAPVHSAVLPPGGTFTWTSPGYAISLTYHTANGHHARLTLQNPNSS
jgi:hypothetical protein